MFTLCTEQPLSPDLLCVSESFGETTRLRSSSTCRWRCWASTWCFCSTPGSPPGAYTASAWPPPPCFTTSSWRPSPGWRWKAFTCILRWSKSLTSTCPRTSSSSAFWVGVSLLLPADLHVGTDLQSRVLLLQVFLCSPAVWCSWSTTPPTAATCTRTNRLTSSRWTTPTPCKCC